MRPALLHPFAKPAAEQFISIVSGSGARVVASDGRQLVDGMAGLWFCAIGHGREEMAEAIAAQVRTIASYSIFEPFTNPPADELAQRLCALAPMPDARVFLTNSGSESIDSAMKLARLSHRLNGQPERQLIVSRSRGYHGTNYGGTSAQGIVPNREGYGALLAETTQLPADDLEAMALLFAERGSEIAAVIAEPVQGAGGVYPAGRDYLVGLRRLCDQHGALLIFDEVITGFGRLGTWFGADYFDVVPDMITFAKAVTSGYQPLGGVLLGRAPLGPLEADPAFMLRHGYTYSGHATACAAALTNLSIIEREGLIERAPLMGGWLSSGLRSLAADGLIAGVRGEVAVWAAVHHDGVDSVAVREEMFARGVICRAVPGANLFCPPLVATEADVAQIIDALADSLSAVGRPTS